jgi:addiction module HigA family antidote
VIKSFADKRTAALFAGYAVRHIPNEIQRRARAKLFAVDAAKKIDDLRVPPRPAIAWNPCTVTDTVSIASALTINGGSASSGATAQHGKLNSWTTTRDDTMSIKREDLDAGRVDFTGIASGKRLAPIHPGEILRDDFLKPMKISVYTLAQVIKVPRSRVNDIVLGRRAITTDTALRLARYFGTSPEFWVNLQTHYDLEIAGRSLRRQIEREISPRAA